MKFSSISKRNPGQMQSQLGSKIAFYIFIFVFAQFAHFQIRCECIIN